VNAKHLFLLLAALAAVCGVTCAPVDEPPPDETRGPRAMAPGAGRTPSLPPPVASGSLQARIEAAIEQTRKRDLLITNGFWTIFHGILGLGPSVPLFDPKTNDRVNALDYLAAGGEIRGLRFLPTADGLDVETRPGMFISQGHQDQFVAEMVQWGVSPGKRFVVGGKDYTFMDFLRHSKARASARQRQELEWAILIIGQHFGTDISWKNNAGEYVDFKDLLRQELDKPLTTAACGGTHRLFGLSWCYYLHLRRGGKADGIWKEVAERLADCKRTARRLQNPDGSFSTDFFKGRGNARDMQLRINTTGHIFEWLALALTDAELQEPWVQEAANALAMMFLEIQSQPMEGGSLYHAAHGLIIYHSRVWGAEKLGPLAPPVPLPPSPGR
jgi:hypothetical protein